MPIIVSLSPATNKTLLQIIQSVCRKLGLAQPSQVISSQDDTTGQLLEIANDEGRELVEGYEWEQLTSEISLTTVAAESQGYISQIINGDLGHIVNDTIWNRTNNWPLYGPLTAQQWQSIKGRTSIGPYGMYRIRGGQLLITPTPTAGDSLYFEWVSKDFCQNAAGTVSQASWQADDDVCILDSRYMELGIVWRWKQLKGLDYQKDEQMYRIAVQQAQSRDGMKPVLSLSTPTQILPFPQIPDGNWPGG